MTKSHAIWALTPGGAKLAQRIGRSLPEADLYMSVSLEEIPESAVRFSGLIDTVSEVFERYDTHLFIMATGIVVRAIAGKIRHKTMDPAVLVIDEGGRHVISLMSGHIGGANAMASEVAAMIGAEPVITTATDVNRVPAIDVLAAEQGLKIENPEAIKVINMAFIRGERVALWDPMNFMPVDMLAEHLRQKTIDPSLGYEGAGVWIHDRVEDLPGQTLCLRPPTLIAGIGCNRGTDAQEIEHLLRDTLSGASLSDLSVAGLASVDLKKDEPGLLTVGESLSVPVEFFTRDQLARVEGIPTPSEMVKKHIGVKSVCEAAAILASRGGELIVPKKTTPNVTVAIARIGFTSSA